MNIKSKVHALVKYSSLYLDSSNATEERNTDDFHIDLPDEEKIRKKLSEDIPVLIMTGEAGEGKSHVIKRISNEAAEKGYTVIEDFSQCNHETREDIIGRLDAVSKGKSDEKFIIGANIGIFVRMILRTSFGLLDEIRNNSHIFYRLNFENRNLAADLEDFRQIVRTFYQYDGRPCDDAECVRRQDCPFMKNLGDLQCDTVIERIRVLCDSVFLTGGHITLRELLSLLASLATLGKDCGQAQREEDAESMRYYNIFDVRDGVVLDKIANLDPAGKLAEDDHILFREVADHQDMTLDLRRFTYRKRENYFISECELPYTKLPIPYLQEYKDFLDKIKQPPYFFDVIESEEPFAALKDGFVKLISPGASDLQITFFDIPKAISSQIKSQFFLNFNELTLAWSHPEWKVELSEVNEPALNPVINSFCLNCYYEDEEDGLKVLPLVIRFDLFEQICRARDHYFLPSSFDILNKYGLTEFFMGILRLDPRYGERVNIVFEPTEGLTDFELRFYTKNKILKSSTKQVRIQKILR